MLTSLWCSFFVLKNQNGLFTMATISYDRSTLISTGVQNTHQSSLLVPDSSWPSKILRRNKGRNPFRWPRGKWAGIRNRPWSHTHCAPLYRILLANVQSLENNLNDLRARIKFQGDIRDCNLLCFTETWLNPADPVHAIQPAEFFSIHRVDRTTVSGKLRGGGHVGTGTCSGAALTTSTCLWKQLWDLSGS